MHFSSLKYFKTYILILVDSQCSRKGRWLRLLGNCCLSGLLFPSIIFSIQTRHCGFLLFHDLRRVRNSSFFIKGYLKTIASKSCRMVYLEFTWGFVLASFSKKEMIQGGCSSPYLTYIHHLRSPGNETGRISGLGWSDVVLCFHTYLANLKCW